MRTHTRAILCVVLLAGGVALFIDVYQGFTKRAVTALVPDNDVCITTMETAREENFDAEHEPVNPSGHASRPRATSEENVTEAAIPPELPAPPSEIELSIARLKRGLAGTNLLRARVAIKEATAEKVAADAKYNPWKMPLTDAARSEVNRVLSDAREQLISLRYQRLEIENTLMGVMLASGEYELAGAGVSDQPRDSDETVWSQTLPDGREILIRLRPGMNIEIDRIALAESWVLADAECKMIAIFQLAYRNSIRR